MIVGGGDSGLFDSYRRSRLTENVNAENGQVMSGVCSDHHGRPNLLIQNNLSRSSVGSEEGTAVAQGWLRPLGFSRADSQQFTAAKVLLRRDSLKVRNQKGFTIIELLIVVAIIGIIAAMRCPAPARPQSGKRILGDGIAAAITARKPAIRRRLAAAATRCCRHARGGVPELTRRGSSRPT